MTDDVLAKHMGIIYKAWWHNNAPYMVIREMRTIYFERLIEIKLLNNTSFCSNYKGLKRGHAAISLSSIERSSILLNESTNIMEFVKALVLK